MKILDKYILFSFLTSYFICFCILIGIFIIIDVLDHVEKYTQYVNIAEKGGKSLSLFNVIFSYYLFHIPIIFYEMSPMITLMAAMFTVTRMAKANELTPLKACGISVFRLLMPIFCMVLFISFIMMADQEYLIPKLSNKLKQFQIIRDSRKSEVLPSIQCADSQGNFFYIKRYYPVQKESKDIRIIQTYDTSPRRERIVIEAYKGVWGERDGKKGLILSKGQYFLYSHKEGFLEPGYPKKFEDEGFFLSTDLNHDKVVLPDSSEYDFISTTDLWKNLQKNPENNELLLLFQTRFTTPIANIILLFLGLPFVLRQETRYFFVGVGLCTLVSGAFYIVNILFINLGFKQFLHPISAAWFPIILFGSLGITFSDLMNH